jgi:hypothetical protein
MWQLLKKGLETFSYEFKQQISEVHLLEMGERRSRSTGELRG